MGLKIKAIGESELNDSPGKVFLRGDFSIESLAEDVNLTNYITD